MRLTHDLVRRAAVLADQSTCCRSTCVGLPADEWCVRCVLAAVAALKRPSPKYRTHEERLIGFRAQIAAREQERADRDRLRVWPHVPKVFTSSDVGRACRVAGLGWYTFQSAMMRAKKRGWIVKTGEALVGRKKIILYAKDGEHLGHNA